MKKREEVKSRSFSYRRITSKGEIVPESKEIVEVSRKLRRNQTDAENKLWEYLRNRKLGGYKFARQHPIGGFIVDFFSREKKLAIELDGSIHVVPEVAERDRLRGDFLESLGIKVIRIQNERVLNNIEVVLKRILSEKETNEQSQLPSPNEERDTG